MSVKEGFAMSRFILLTIVLLTTVRADAQLFAPPTAPNQIVVDATNVLAQSVAMQDGLPRKMLADAQAVAIVPNTVRGAFVVGAQYGRGVLLVRGPGGAWQAPRMMEITGGSLGYQIGVQSTDLILIFRTPQSVANAMRGGMLKVGVDASVAAGPVGRQASAATDLQLKAEIWSYSRTRGAFVGASIAGSSLHLDSQTDAAYYQPPGTVPASATQLVQLLATLSSAGPPTGSLPALPVAAVGALPVVPAPPSEIEIAKQQLDAASRQLAANLDDRWKVYLALPPELYMPNHMPSIEELEQAIHRYEAVSQQPQYAALTNQPAFQATLKGLWRLGELQQGAQRKLSLPAPPAVR
jgi:lipid-binding SYLF domain-containing protein